MCEDRGIEDYGQLPKLLNGAATFTRKLVKLFTEADDRYNSGLFHFHKEKDRHEPRTRSRRTGRSTTSRSKRSSAISTTPKAPTSSPSYRPRSSARSTSNSSAR